MFCFLVVILFACSGKKGSYDEEIIVVSQECVKYCIRNVKIFTGKDQELTNEKDVYIANGKIDKITDASSSIIIDGGEIVDGKGKVLMPGFIDSHVHLAGSGSVPWDNVKPNIDYNLKAYLFAGITTVYDLGGMAKSTRKIGNQIKEGKKIGPQVFNTHVPITVLGSHPIPLAKETAPYPLNKLVDKMVPTIGSPDEAEALISKYVEHEIDYVKVICDQLPSGTKEMSFKQLEAIVKVAHDKGYKVFVHVGSAQNAIDAVQAKADVLAHGIVRDELTEEQAEIIAKSKVPVIYTIAGFENVYRISSGEFEASKWDSILLPQEILKPICGVHGEDFNSAPVLKDFAKDVRNNKKYWKENFRKLHKAGVSILVGTDSSLPGTYTGSTYFQEIKTLKLYGMSNYEILTGATFQNAKLLEEDPSFGIIKVGARADLLLLNDNPLVNLNTIENPAMIIANGLVVNRK